jgi:hypothetical protein
MLITAWLFLLAAYPDILTDVRLSLARRRDIRHRVTQPDQGG